MSEREWTPEEREETVKKLTRWLERQTEVDAALTAAADRERVGMTAARVAVCRELNQAVERFNADDSKGMGNLIDVIAPWLEEAQAPMVDVVWMTRDEMREAEERETALREELEGLRESTEERAESAEAQAAALQQENARLVAESIKDFNDCEDQLGELHADVARLTGELAETQRVEVSEVGNQTLDDSLSGRLLRAESALAAQRQKAAALVKEWTRRRDLMATTDKATGKMATYIDGLIDAHSDVLKDVAEHLPSLAAAESMPPQGAK